MCYLLARYIDSEMQLTTGCTWIWCACGLSCSSIFIPLFLNLCRILFMNPNNAARSSGTYSTDKIQNNILTPLLHTFEITIGNQQPCKWKMTQQLTCNSP